MITTIDRPETIAEPSVSTSVSTSVAPLVIKGTTLGDLIRGSRVPQNNGAWFSKEMDANGCPITACALGTALIEAAYRDVA